MPWRIVRASSWSCCTHTSPNRSNSRLIGLDANKFALISARSPLSLSFALSVSLSSLSLFLTRSSPEDVFLCLQLCLADASGKVCFNFLCRWKKLNPYVVASPAPFWSKMVIGRTPSMHVCCHISSMNCR